MGFGIAIIAVNSRGYGEMAFNLAVSLKGSFDVPIAVISDGQIEKVRDYHLWVDEIIQPPEINPFEIKTSLWELSPFDKTLYIDADSLYIGKPEDLKPWIESIQRHSFLIGEYKRWKQGETMNSSWAILDEIWKAYGLKSTSIYPECNSSMFYFDRSKANERLFKRLKECYGEKVNLRAKAGDYFPDEVAWGAAMALNRRYSNIEGWMPCYFNWHSDKRPQDYPFVSMAGKNQPPKLVNAYNATVALNYQKFRCRKFLFDPKKKLYGFI